MGLLSIPIEEEGAHAPFALHVHMVCKIKDIRQQQLDSRRDLRGGGILCMHKLSWTPPGLQAEAAMQVQDKGHCRGAQRSPSTTLPCSINHISLLADKVMQPFEHQEDPCTLNWASL